MARILFYSDCFIYGGSEKVLENLINSDKIREQFEIVFVFNYSKEYDESVRQKIATSTITHPVRLISNETFFYKLDLLQWNPLLTEIIKIPFKLLKKTGLYGFYSYFKLRRTFRKFQPDLLFINNGGYPAALTCRIAVFAGYSCPSITRIIFNVNNLAKKPQTFFARLFDRELEKKIDTFVTASKAAGRRLVEYRNFSPHKCINIPNTITELSVGKNENAQCFRDYFKISADCITIGCIGLLTERKGHVYLLEAISTIQSEEQFSFKLLMFGDGEERNKLNQLIIKYGLEDRCILAGYDPNVIKVMPLLDFLVLPSIDNEDFPYVNVEAMACGKPLVVTDVAGMPEQVDHAVNGFVVPAKDVTQLAYCIDLLIRDESLRISMGIASRKKFLREFQYSIVIDKYLKLFNDQLKRD